MVDVLRGGIRVRPRKRAFRPSAVKKPKVRHFATLYSEKSKDLPKIDDKSSSVTVIEGTFTKPRNHRALLESYGHPIRGGHRVGSDNFFVFLDKEDPGFGPVQSVSSGPLWWGSPNAPEFGTYQWRPTLARSFDSAFYDPNLYPSSVLTRTVRDLPEVDTPEFADFTLDLNDRGTNFIKLCRPGNPVANLGQFVVELRDLPQIPFLEARAKFFARLGSEFLNVVFGWEPFVKDLVKVYKLQRILDIRLNQLIQGNGLTQKRTRTHVTPEDVSYLASGDLSRPFGDISIDDDDVPIDDLKDFVVLGPEPYFPWDVDSSPSYQRGTWQLYHGSLSYDVTRTKNRVDWYSGLFTYYVPDIGSSRWTDKAVAALHESNVTPAVLYEVYPWSWLLDWFTNVGDIVSNLSTNAVENEVLVDSFIMSRRSDLTEVSVYTQWDAHTSYFHFGLPDEKVFHVPAGQARLKHKRLLLHKLRHPASPFGFGLSTSSFSTKQWLILAALGLTHQRSF